MMSKWEMLEGKLWQGTMVDNWSSLDDIKPDLVVNLAGNEYALPTYGSDFTYILHPIDDGPLPDNMHRFWIFAGMCSDAIRNGEKVFVHCAAGVNRSSLLTGCILFLQRVAHGPALVDYIKEKRPGALSNESFANFLSGLPDTFLMREEYIRKEALGHKMDDDDFGGP